MRLAVSAAALLATACLEAPPSSQPGDGGPGDGGPPPALCGTTSTVRDEFNAESPEWQRAGSTALEGGRVQLYAAPGESAGLRSTFAYQLEGSELTMQLRSVGSGDGEVHMLLINQEDDVVGLELAGDNLSLVQRVGESIQTGAATDFEPGLLWWRLREAAGRLGFATSTDDSSWQEHGDLVLEVMGPVWVLVETTAGDLQSMLEIEAFRPSGDESLCPVSSMVDDFDGPSRRWVETGALGCTVSTSGALEIAYDGSDACGLRTAEHFDLRGGAVGIELVAARDCDPASKLSLELADLAPEFVCINDGSGPVLHAQLNGDGSPGELGSMPFDPEVHRFWQIRHDPVAGQLLFETRGEATEWDTLGLAPVEDDAVRGAAIGVYVTDASPGDLGDPVVFDRLNLVPP